MRAKIQQWVYQVRGSYWFVPALMAIGAILLSQLMVHVDRRVGSAWMMDSWWASLNQPEGARTLLATVAGSMITVAGVTFSLTILAVSYATSHYGPRLLDNFMQDRGNQVTLGTFLATFLYCLLVLRTVRSGSDVFNPTASASVFVPHLSVLIAVALTLASVGVLIYFIHHIPESIHISNVLSRISQQLSWKITDLYPESLGEGGRSEPAGWPSMAAQSQPISVCRSGYLQGIDETQLLDSARDANAVIELLVRPGNFLMRGQRIAEVHFPEPSDDETFQRAEANILGALAIGATRTPTQDIEFITNQLFEIAVRALSPGVNDPLTAIQCIDQLAKGLVELSRRSLPSRYRHDEEGNLRVVTTDTSWERLVHQLFGGLLPYVESDEKVARHMLNRIHSVVEISQNESMNRSLEQLADRLRIGLDRQA